MKRILLCRRCGRGQRSGSGPWCVACRSLAAHAPAGSLLPPVISCEWCSGPTMPGVTDSGGDPICTECLALPGPCNRRRIA